MKLLTTAILTILFVTAAFAQGQTEFATAHDDVAFEGNDLVSYFNAGSPQKGLPQFAHEYHGLNLLFASQDNLNKFEANPSKYLPEYNGWCAIALTQGSWIQPDFNEYKIQDGKLLFFEVRAFYNGKTAWDKDPELHKIVADSKYRQLKTDG